LRLVLPQREKPRFHKRYLFPLGNALRRLAKGRKGLSFLGMELPFQGMRLPSQGIELPFQGMRLPFLGIELPFLGMKRPFLGMRLPFLGMKRPFLGMKRLFGGGKRPVQPLIQLKMLLTHPLGPGVPSTSCGKLSLIDYSAAFLHSQLIVTFAHQGK
jgi:hypothetical protein